MEPEEKSRWDDALHVSVRNRGTSRTSSWYAPRTISARAAPGLALDLAGGAGRNSMFLLERGWRVTWWISPMWRLGWQGKS